MNDERQTDTQSYPWFKRGLKASANADPIRASDIPLVDQAEKEAPEDYLPDEGLTYAVNVSLALGMPLLLTGEPGTGKTRLADALAHDLGCVVHKFETKSTSMAKDLFYSYDALSAFKRSDVTDPREFIRYEALGRAILEAFPTQLDALEKLLPPNPAPADRHVGPRRAIVLIDEIDKAPRDFPNDLLNEIDRLYFRVPELSNAGSPGANGEVYKESREKVRVPDKYRPIVIITSNSEKGLPDAFLRRCVYYHIEFPDVDRMEQIVAQRLKKVEDERVMLKDALSLFYRFRSNPTGRSSGLSKEPSTAELLNWVQLLLFVGVTPGESLRDHEDKVLQTLPTLVKNEQDRKLAQATVAGWLKQEPG